jgi:uroporphyrinogen decarboxylase
LVETTSAYLLAQIAAGADCVQIFESWAGALDDAGFAAWSIGPVKRIVAAVKNVYPHVPVIGFPRGAGMKIGRFAIETGVDAISADTTYAMADLAKSLGPKIILQGNLDPMRLIAGGAALESGTRRILEGMAGRPFVFNLGHGILPETPLEHVSQLLAEIRSTGA